MIKKAKMCTDMRTGSPVSVCDRMMMCIFVFTHTRNFNKKNFFFLKKKLPIFAQIIFTLLLFLYSSCTFFRIII